MDIKPFFVETATESDLDNEAALYGVFSREYYGDTHSYKPNEHCFWDAESEAWLETDQHLRERILQRIGRP